MNVKERGRGIGLANGDAAEPGGAGCGGYDGSRDSLGGRLQSLPGFQMYRLGWVHQHLSNNLLNDFDFLDHLLLHYHRLFNFFNYFLLHHHRLFNFLDDLFLHYDRLCGRSAAAGHNDEQQSQQWSDDQEFCVQASPKMHN